MSGRNVDSGTLGKSKDDNGHNGTVSESHPQPPPPITTWYEQIQFKAQYYHFRTNNYAAIVKSANSFDKVTLPVIPLIIVTAPEQSIAKTCSVAHERHEPDKSKSKSKSHESPPGVQSACWNFPRMKFRHIFSGTKSLDDILERSSQEKETRASSSLVDKDDCLIRRSVQNSSPSKFLHLPKSTRPRSSSTESTVNHPSLQKPTTRATLNFNFPIAHSKSATDVQIEHRPFHYHFPKGPQVVPLLSASSSDTICFTSSEHFSSSKPIPHKITHNQSESISSPPPPPTASPSALEVTPILSIPQIRLTVPISTKMKQGTTTSTKHFLKNKVEPTPSPVTGAVEGRKLVVASVSYLQRPSSPSPVTPGVSPASSQPPTPHGLSPSVTSVFNSSVTPGESPPPFLPRLKPTRFFTSCCSSGNDVTLGGVLNKNEKSKSTISSSSQRVPISILKNTVHLGLQDKENNKSTCSRETNNSSRTENESLEDFRQESKENLIISPTVRPLPPPPVACGEAQGTFNQGPRGKSEEEERMADLQSPHYVKRTAHMFNSKYISSAQNGSHTTDGVSASCSPSYLNVSRSVSGYSCLSYSSASQSTNGHSQPINNGSHTSRTPFRTSRSILRHHSSFPAKSPLRDYPARKYSDSSPPPPPLPKSAPPLASPALVGQSTQRINQNGRSLIMEKIERLYGQSGELESSTFVWRRRTPPPPIVSPIERIIPIQVENESEKQNSPSSNGFHAKSSSLPTIDNYSESEGRNEDDVDHKSMEKSTYLHERDMIISQNITKEQPPPKGVRSVEQESSSSEGFAAASLESTPLINQSASNKIVTDSLEPTVSIMAPINKENEFMSREKDGSYFLGELEREKLKIEGLIEEKGIELNNVDPMGEESGRIRAAIGKARLLVYKKFNQFEGLCHTNLRQARYGVPADEPFPTKNEDLEGFWDMVLIQVDQIHSIFDDLDPIRFKEKNEKSQQGVKKIPFKKSGASNKATTTKATRPKAGLTTSSSRDESRRKLLAEKRQAMKSLAQQENNSSGDGKIVHSEDQSTEVHIFSPPNEKLSD